MVMHRATFVETYFRAASTAGSEHSHRILAATKISMRCFIQEHNAKPVRVFKLHTTSQKIFAQSYGADDRLIKIWSIIYKLILFTNSYMK